MTTVVVAALVAVVAMMVVLWVVSLLVADASIADIFWGLGFVVVAWVSVWRTPVPSVRGSIVPVLVTAWGLRLALHLAVRNLGKGEDSRYRAMRAHHGPRFGWVSLFTVFLFQGALIWIVSLPVQAAIGAGERPLGWMDAVAALLVLAGLVVESVADAQLTRFRRDRFSAGQVMDRGLWRYSRHPNYFGDAVVWWGFGLFGLATGLPWTAVGPLVMTVFLLKVSGVALLESTIVERRPAYRDYIARTSAFLPWPPKRG